MQYTVSSRHAVSRWLSSLSIICLLHAVSISLSALFQLSLSSLSALSQLSLSLSPLSALSQPPLNCVSALSQLSQLFLISLSLSSLTALSWALFLFFYKGKDSLILDFLQRKTWPYSWLFTMENIVLFLTFYNGKHSPIHDFLQWKTGRGRGGQLTYPIIYIDIYGSKTPSSCQIMYREVVRNRAWHCSTIGLVSLSKHTKSLHTMPAK